MTPEDVEEGVTTILRKLRNPYYKSLSIRVGDGDSSPDSDIQDLGNLEKLEAAFSQLNDEIVAMVNTVVEGQGQSLKKGPESLDRQALMALFDRQGILGALKRDPSLKEVILRITHQLLKEYPFMPNPNHGKRLKETESFPEIIPNIVAID